MGNALIKLPFNLAVLVQVISTMIIKFKIDIHFYYNDEHNKPELCPDSILENITIKQKFLRMYTFLYFSSKPLLKL